LDHVLRRKPLELVTLNGDFAGQRVRLAVDRPNQLSLGVAPR